MDALVRIAVYGIATVLVLFIVAGAATFAAGVRQGRARTRAGTAVPTTGAGGRGGPRAALRRYVGPVEPRHALLNPPLRVGVEAISALFGFPGLGWLASGKVVTGLVLLVAGPSFIWGLFPVYLIATQRMADHPYLFIQYLPLVSVMSAGALGIHQLRLAHSRTGERRVEAPH